MTNVDRVLAAVPVLTAEELVKLKNLLIKTRCKAANGPRTSANVAIALNAVKVLNAIDDRMNE